MWTDVEIDFIRLLSKRSRYLAAANGVLYEALGGKMRKILYMLPEQTLEWAIDVPESDPTFEFGNGILENRPVTFEVSVGTGDEATVLHERTLRSASEWQDFRLDLSAWAGQSVQLRLRASGDPGSVALWSDPLLSSRPKKRFNVIVLLEDALRADYLSAYGYERETSPNKTAIMRERGIQFDWAMSQATKTRPSVPSLMTSLYPTATGVWHFSDMLSERYLTLAGFFGLRASPPPSSKTATPGLCRAPSGLRELYSVQIMGHATEEVYGEHVFSWLERHRDRNFSLPARHRSTRSIRAAAAVRRLVPELAGEGTPVARNNEFEPGRCSRPPRDVGYAMPARSCTTIPLFPRLLEKLSSLGLADDTLLILLADHGEYMGEHGYWAPAAGPHARDSRAPHDDLSEAVPGGEADRGPGAADRRHADHFGARRGRSCGPPAAGRLAGRSD